MTYILIAILFFNLLITMHTVNLHVKTRDFTVYDLINSILYTIFVVPFLVFVGFLLLIWWCAENLLYFMLLKVDNTFFSAIKKSRIGKKVLIKKLR